ncbi:MAG: hypothetical protein ACKOYM_07605, partial [Actinomycetes bacterium]
DLGEQSRHRGADAAQCCGYVHHDRSSVGRVGTSVIAMDGSPATASNTNDPLEALEADFAAVDAALTSLDQIDLHGRSGAAVVAEIQAVVDPSRFDRPAPGGQIDAAEPAVVDPDAAGVEAAADDAQRVDSDLVGDGLVDEQVDAGTD